MINGVEGLFKIDETTPLTRPLSILTDQLFAASTSAVRLEYCKTIEIQIDSGLVGC